MHASCAARHQNLEAAGRLIRRGRNDFIDILSCGVWGRVMRVLSHVFTSAALRAIGLYGKLIPASSYQWRLAMTSRLIENPKKSTRECKLTRRPASRCFGGLGSTLPKELYLASVCVHLSWIVICHLDMELLVSNASRQYCRNTYRGKAWMIQHISTASCPPGEQMSASMVFSWLNLFHSTT